MHYHSGNMEIDRHMATLFDQLHSFQRVQQEIAEARQTGQAADGLAEVTVGPSGNLLDIQLNLRTARPSPHEISESIMEAYKNACGQMGEHLNGLMAPILPDGVQLGEKLVGANSLPAVGLDGTVGDALRVTRDLLANENKRTAR